VVAVVEILILRMVCQDWPEHSVVMVLKVLLMVDFVEMLVDKEVDLVLVEDLAVVLAQPLVGAQQEELVLLLEGQEGQKEVVLPVILVEMVASAEEEAVNGVARALQVVVEDIQVVPGQWIMVLAVVEVLTMPAQTKVILPEFKMVMGKL
jgi:hypothetical protein